MRGYRSASYIDCKGRTINVTYETKKQVYKLQIDEIHNKGKSHLTIECIIPKEEWDIIIHKVSPNIYLIKDR